MLPISPILLVHICTAVVGLLSGYLAMIYRKGSGGHGAAGTVFFVSMLLMSASGAYIGAFVRPIMLNVVVGTLTFYLVATSWRTARRREKRTDVFDVIAMLWATSVGIAGLTFAIAGTKDKLPAPLYFAFGSVALLAAYGDLRMLLRGGAAGTQRIARHLWRMCFALLTATISFYPGQGKLFPKAIRDTGILMLPHVLLIGALLYWVIRMTRQKRAQKKNALQPSYAAAVAAN